MTHRIDINEALEAWDDLTPADKDDLLAVLYPWRAEAVTDALRRIVEPVVGMSQAHLPRTNREIAPGTTICVGDPDPLTGLACQFAGTAEQHRLHLIERIATACANPSTPPGGLG